MFNFFPNTDFNKINLDWIMRKLKEQISGLVASVNGMTGDVTITAENIGALPADTTPADIGAVSVVNAYRPAEFDIAAYKQGTLSAIASWLVNEIESTSIVNPASLINRAPTLFYGHYDDNGKSYDTLFQTYSSQPNTYDRTTTYAGQPVIYMNCAAMASTILKGRDYENSAPYYGITAGDEWDKDTALSLCWEKGTTNTFPWTIDFLNNIFAAYMGCILEKSGCFPRLLREANSTTINQDVLDNMETGDIIFFGKPAQYPDRYKGIVHVVYYIKDITELNAAGAYYNAEFQPVEYPAYMDTTHGIIFHSSGGVSDEWHDSIRLETLDHVMFASLYNNANVWVYKPWSNAMNSNKQLRKLTGTFRAGDVNMFGVSHYGNENTTPAHGAEYDQNYPGRFTIINPALKGITRLDSLTNLNGLYDGLFSITNFNTISNGVPSALSTAVIFQFGSGTGNIVQMAFEQASARRAYYRYRVGDTWSAWVLLTERAADNIIPSGETIDLNDYRGYHKSGSYLINTGVTITNAPNIAIPTTVRWILNVDSPDTENTYCVQTLTSVTAESRKLERIYSGSAWSAWKEFTMA